MKKIFEIKPPVKVKQSGIDSMLFYIVDANGIGVCSIVKGYYDINDPNKDTEESLRAEAKKLVIIINLGLKNYNNQKKS